MPESWPWLTNEIGDGLVVAFFRLLGAHHPLPERRLHLVALGDARAGAMILFAGRDRVDRLPPRVTCWFSHAMGAVFHGLQRRGFGGLHRFFYPGVAGRCLRL